MCWVAMLVMYNSPPPPPRRCGRGFIEPDLDICRADEHVDIKHPRVHSPSRSILPPPRAPGNPNAIKWSTSTQFRRLYFCLNSIRARTTPPLNCVGWSVCLRCLLFSSRIFQRSHAARWREGSEFDFRPLLIDWKTQWRNSLFKTSCTLFVGHKSLNSWIKLHVVIYKKMLITTILSLRKFWWNI